MNPSSHFLRMAGSLFLLKISTLLFLVFFWLVCNQSHQFNSIPFFSVSAITKVQQNGYLFKKTSAWNFWQFENFILLQLSKNNFYYQFFLKLPKYSGIFNATICFPNSPPNQTFPCYPVMKTKKLTKKR